MQYNFSQIKFAIKQQNKPAQHTRSICFCVDEGYLPYALFVAKQILELEQKLEFDICICLPDMSLISDEFLNLNIRFIEIDISGFDELPVGSLSLAAYHRLFLPHIFAETYEYIFYLDADTYILRPFSEEINCLIKKLPSSFSVGAVADIAELQMRVRSDNKFKKILSYLNYYHEKNHTYRNSGVLLINVRNYIQESCLERIFAYAFDENSNLRCHDQSALNGALLDELVILPFTFNWQAHKLTYGLTDEFQPYIVHFIGENKPWSLNNVITKPYQNAYQNFLGHHFLELSEKLETLLEKRAKNPKYKNKFREMVSLYISDFKGFLKEKEYSSKHEVLTTKSRLALSKEPFI